MRRGEDSEQSTTQLHLREIRTNDARKVIVALVTNAGGDWAVGHRIQSQLACDDENGTGIRRQDEAQYDEIDPTSSTNESAAGDACALDSEIDWNPWWLSNGSKHTTVSIIYRERGRESERR